MSYVKIRKGVPSNLADANGQSREHRVVAQRALGRDLPPKAVVHHVDGKCSRNTGANLVLCEDQAYHMLLHVRGRALKECGNANHRRCSYCTTYDATKNMRVYGSATAHHRSCFNVYRRARRNQGETMNDEFLTTGELAKRWGVSRHTILNWRHRKKNPLPAHTSPTNGRNRYTWAQVERWYRRSK